MKVVYFHDCWTGRSKTPRAKNRADMWDTDDADALEEQIGYAKEHRVILRD